MFIEVPKVRDIEVFDTVSDIKAHIKRSLLKYSDQRYSIEYGFEYDEVGTWAHENCHQINNNVRNKQSVKSNCAYWLDSRAYVRPEITGVKLSDVANAVPKDMRGHGYNLYMIQQQRYWNNEPLYVIDELAAYRIGTLARMENNERPDYSCSLFIEFCGYLAVLIKLTEEFIPLLNVAMSDAHGYVAQINTARDLTGQLHTIEEYINGP